VDEAFKALLADSILTFYRANAKTTAIRLLRQRNVHPN
jgi:hypothetical protein